MNLGGIIDSIDTLILTKLPQNFVPYKAFGLAQRYYDDKTYYPGVIPASGEITNPFLQDQYAVSWYHRNETGGYILDEDQQGDNNNNQIEKNSVELIVFYNSTKTKNSGTHLKDVFIDAIPSVLSKVIRESLNLSSCDMVLISHELDSSRVLTQECNKEGIMRVGAEHGLLAIRYEVISSYRRDCINVCDC